MKKVIALLLCLNTLTSCLATSSEVAKILSHLTEEDLYQLFGVADFKPQPRLTANLNDYVDKLFTNLNNFLAEIHLDRLPLADISSGFSIPLPLLPPVTGKISLTDGNLTGINSIYRSGDVILTYVDKVLTLNAPIGLKKVNADFDYSATLLGIGPKGGVEITLNNLRITINVSIDLEEILITLNHFSIDGTGFTTVKFTGLILTDLVTSVLTTVVTNIIQPILLNQIEKSLNDPIQDALDSINKAIHDFLDPVSV